MFGTLKIGSHELPVTRITLRSGMFWITAETQGPVDLSAKLAVLYDPDGRQVCAIEPFTTDRAAIRSARRGGRVTVIQPIAVAETIVRGGPVPDL